MTPRRFANAAGKAYHPRIDVRVLMRFEAQTNICLLQPEKDPFQGKLTHLMRLAFLASHAPQEWTEESLDAFCAEFNSGKQTRGVAEALAGALADFSRRQIQK